MDTRAHALRRGNKKVDFRAELAAELLINIDYISIISMDFSSQLIPILRYKTNCSKA